MIQSIAFDFGGTLFSTSTMDTFTPAMEKTFVDGMISSLGCSASEAQKIYDKYIEAWKGRRARATQLPDRETSSADLLQITLESAGANLNRDRIVSILDAFHQKVAEEFHPLDKVIDTLPVLSKAGYRLAVVSNNVWTESIHASFRRFKLNELFESVVASCDVGYRKPHPRIFEELVRRLELSPGEILFVGDSYHHDIATPKRLGFKTCLVDFEGTNENNQLDYVREPDAFLTRFDALTEVVAKLT